MNYKLFKELERLGYADTWKNLIWARDNYSLIVQQENRES